MASSETPTASCPLELKPGTSSIEPMIDRHVTALVVVLGFGGFSVLLALLYNAIRKHVFKDTHNLDTVFDAGGRVSVSLTAVTVTSQVLWPSDFLQSATLVSKTGLGGCLWSTIAIVLSLLVFQNLSLTVKTRAPGAKTYPQIVFARFGKPAHIVFCCAALSTNVVTTTGLILAGKTALEMSEVGRKEFPCDRCPKRFKVLTKDISTEFAVLVMAVLFGAYCMIGGLGTTFYVSYFNTALTFISVTVFILQTTYLPSSTTQTLASSAALYDAMTCVKGPEGNFGESLLTFRSSSGLWYGVVFFFSAISLGFCDQANWQSRIASKPSQGVIGFLVAAFLFFAIPTSVTFTTAMAYVSISFQNGTHRLGQSDIDNGYITPYVMQTLLGTSGGYLLLTMLMMALMSTGSGEIMSISSIIVYDLIKTYIRPFRQGVLPMTTQCVLCWKDKVTLECECPSALDCPACVQDKKLASRRSWHRVFYDCAVHGEYRHYEDTLIEYKNWCMIFLVIGIVPFGLVISETGINLHWAIMAATTLFASFASPLFLSIAWAKATGKGLITGALSGMLVGIVAMLAVGSTYEGGLSDFFVNTGKEYSLLASLVSALVVSTVVSVAVSLYSTTVKTAKDEASEWTKTMSIDNPLSPYRALYAEELSAVNAGRVVSTDMMAKIFRKSRLASYGGACFSVAVFLVIIPSIALSYEIPTLSEFQSWMAFFHIWCFVGTVFVVLLPPIEEGIQIARRLRENRNDDKLDTMQMAITI